MPVITGPLGLWQYPMLNAIIEQRGSMGAERQKVPAERAGVIIQPWAVRVGEEIQKGRIVTRRPGAVGGFLIDELNRRLIPAWEQVTRTSPGAAEEAAKRIADTGAGRPPILSQKVTIS